MSKAYITALGDTGLKKESVIYNDAVSLKETIKRAGYEAEIVLREDVEKIKGTDNDVLFVLYAGVINFGGKQTPHVVKVIKKMNSFKGKVVLFFNDVMDNPRNDMRDEFVHVNRPIYLANPIEPEIAAQSVINFNVIDAVQMNQSWTIGKKLVERKDDETEPLFDLAYGGRNRPGVLKELKAIFEKAKSGVVFNGVAKELKGGAIKELNIKKKVDNSLFREMISLGKYTVIPYEKKKDYVTSRMFEAMTSNAITLFNKKEVKVEGLVLPELQYETPQGAVGIINGEYDEELLQEQHEIVRKFDFDKHIEQEAEAFRKMLTE